MLVVSICMFACASSKQTTVDCNDMSNDSVTMDSVVKNILKFGEYYMHRDSLNADVLITDYAPTDSAGNVYVQRTIKIKINKNRTDSAGSIKINKNTIQNHTVNVRSSKSNLLAKNSSKISSDTKSTIIYIIIVIAIVIFFAIIKLK